jgi:hypothetical protein
VIGRGESSGEYSRDSGRDSGKIEETRGGFFFY